MKHSFIKRFAGITAFLVFATQLMLPVYATEEASNAASSANNASSAATSSSTTCKTGDVNCTTSSNTSTTSQNTSTNSSATAADTSATSATGGGAGSSASTVTSGTSASGGVSITTSTGAVDAKKVVESVEKAVTTSTSDTTTSTSVNTTVNAVIKNLEGASTSTVTNTVSSVESAVTEKVNKLNKEILQKPADRAKLLKEIEQLKSMRTQLRAKTMEVNKELISVFKKVEQLPGLFEIRWGNLNNKRKACTEVSAKELQTALDDKTVPEKCLTGMKKVEYKGKISVDHGTLYARKKILFEKDDYLVVASGSSISFDSVIYGHWDGLIVEYQPETVTDSAGNVKKSEVVWTVSIGDLNQSFKGSEVLGVKKIGNGHQIGIKHARPLPPGLPNPNEVIKEHLKILDKISDLREKLDRLRLLGKGGTDMDDIEKLIDGVNDYGFDNTSAATVVTEVETLSNALTDNISVTDITKRTKDLKDKISKTKKDAKRLKFTQKLIPFKDTDDDQWFTKYVSAVKNLGIVSGYKDKSGKDLGEYRPANNVTVAEILKIGLETADKDKKAGVAPKLNIAAKHWSKEYVVKGEELGLDLVKNTQSLDRPATRGEVVRMMLEALEIKPTSVSSTSFSDVTSSDKNAPYIEYAKNIGIVSGDDGKDTFRPNAPINRAEVAKIADLVNTTIVGESVDGESSDKDTKSSTGTNGTSATPINLP